MSKHLVRGGDAAGLLVTKPKDAIDTKSRSVRIASVESVKLRFRRTPDVGM